jgi:hypothetical protein
MNKLHFLAMTIYALEAAHQSAVEDYEAELLYWGRFIYYTRTGRFPD